MPIAPGLVLVVNAGSSSLKFSVFRANAGGENAGGELEAVVDGQVEGIGARACLTVKDRAGAPPTRVEYPKGTVKSCKEALPLAGGWLRERFAGEQVVAVGHRVVHGGTKFVKPVLLDDAVFAELERLVPLAPLHQPHSLDGIRAVKHWNADIPQVICVDTAFHRQHPKLADLYALPYGLYEEGIRRYGFHGTSYEYIASVLPSVAPEIAAGRVVVAHLGSGASLCALRGGKSVDTTMGFSTLDGLAMGTRPGGLDAGVLLYLLGQKGLTLEAVERLLYFESGLKGLSGLTNDMRILLESGEPRAQLAVDYFVACAAKEIAAMAASLGGLDGLVFTAGIGENSPEIRARMAGACAWLGLELDAAANSRGGPRISTAASPVSAWVVRTDEDRMIARHTVALLAIAR